MPRFFFHLRHGASVERDTVGFLCSDVRAAGDVARNCMMEMLAEGDQEIGQHAVEITDASGTVLAIVKLGPDAAV